MKSFEKLRTKLAELFQLDQADLDFGIYRIMNARRDEINGFLENDLLPQVHKAFSEYKSCDKAEIQQDLDKVIGDVEGADMDPEQSPKVKELRKRLAEEAVDITALENEVYDHLYSFFSRYYAEGDFISLRRYKEGVYAIPYEGEEVKLHWANRDQYYVKTTESFRDYAFNTPSGHRVHFKITEADTDKDNTKAANGNDRRFLLHSDKPVAEEQGELVVRFEYRPDGEKRKQEAINADTAERVFEGLDDEKLTIWKDRLAIMWESDNGNETDKTILDKYLFDYSRRNTFDYFIHKDLGGFLRRELDFYIKSEVMRLDDVEEESAPRVEQYLSKIKIIRRIAHKIIDFLAQIENFQKKLWLKKKFVVETNYGITLDRIPEGMFTEIAANDAQRQEWVRLFAIDEIKGDLAGAIDYSEPLTSEFLKTNPFLVLDTKFFGEQFKDKLLGSMEDVEGNCDGVLVHGENFQALQVIAPRFARSVDAIYVDPPYNTGTESSEFIYKNAYQHSSWITFIENRFSASIPLLRDNGIFCVTIDDYEYRHLSVLCDAITGCETLGTVVIRNKPQGRPTATGFSVNHEYALFLGRKGLSSVGRLPREGKKAERYPEIDEIGIYAWANLRKTGSGSNREDRPKQYYPIYIKADSIRIPKIEWIETNREWRILEKPADDEEVLYPIDDEGNARVWNLSPRRVISDISDLKVVRGTIGTQIQRKYRPNYEGALPGTWWDDKLYSASESGTKILQDIMGREREFPFPKSVFAVRDCLRAADVGSRRSAAILDFFGGSGTTAHAVIELNRGDNGTRKYILVEMGEHFNTVLKPRIQKVVYSKDWKDGKPVSRDGISHMFKYIRLESYEDALANIEIQRTDPQQMLLDKAGDFRESYILKYILDVEARGSQILRNIDIFDDPWNYQLFVSTGSVGETKPVNVDLIETFNWVAGLKVKHVDRVSGFHVVVGDNPKGERVLVIWRKVRDLAETDPKKITVAREKANRDLDAFFRKQQYNTLDSEFDVIFVNGDNNLMNVPLDPDREGVEPGYKVRLIEEEFKQLMFEVKDI